MKKSNIDHAGGQQAAAVRCGAARDAPVGAVGERGVAAGSGVVGVSSQGGRVGVELGRVVRRIVVEIVSVGSSGWGSWDAVFALTPGGQAAEIVFAVGEDVVWVDIVAGLIPGRPGGQLRVAVDWLVSAVQGDGVTGEVFAAVFDDPDHLDIDGGLAQFSLAGTVSGPGWREILERDAVDRVRVYILGWGLDTIGYPLSRLMAERVEVGWRVSVPVASGEIVLDRAMFYVADDGVVERSSRAVAASEYAAGSARRYRLRQGIPV